MTDNHQTEERPAGFRPVRVFLERENKRLEFDRVNTVLQLLNKLGLKQGTALVIRDGGLLTPDLKINPGDEITVRTVISRG